MFCKRSLLQTRMLLAGSSRLAQTVHGNFQATAARPFATKDNFLQGNNANYIDFMYESWQSDPKSVNPSWQAYFATGDFQTAPTLGQTPRDAQLEEILKLLKKGGAPGLGVNSAEAAVSATENIQIYRLIRAHMAYGHLLANLDPLDLKKHYKHIPSFAEKYNFPTEHSLSLLDYHSYGFTEADLEREFRVQLPFKGAISEKQSVWKLKDLI